MKVKNESYFVRGKERSHLYMKIEARDCSPCSQFIYGAEILKHINSEYKRMGRRHPDLVSWDVFNVWFKVTKEQSSEMKEVLRRIENDEHLNIQVRYTTHKETIRNS